MARKLTVSLELNLDKFAAGLKTGLNMGKRFKMNFDKVMDGIDIDVDKVGFQQDLESLERQYEKFEKDIENDEIDIRTGGGFSQLANFGIVAGTVTMGLQQIGSAARNTIRPYVEFEKSLSRINTIADVSEQKLSALGDGMEEIATTVGIEMNTLADGMYEALSRGIEFGNALNFMEKAARAAKAGSTEVGTTVRATTTVINAFNKSAEDTDEILDVMFQTVDKGGTTFEALANHISDVAPIAASSGVSFKEISAAISTITKQGTPTAKATTQIKRAILSLDDVLGKGWSETMSFQEALEKVVEKAENSDKSLKELMGRVQGYQGLLQLTGKSAEMFAEDQKNMENSTDAMGSAFADMANDLQHQLDLLSANFSNLKRNLTQILLPAINPVIAGLKSYTSSISDLLEQDVSDKLKKEREEFNALVGILKSANTTQETRNRAISTLQNQYSDYIGNIDLERTSLKKLNEMQKKVNESFMEQIRMKAAEEQIQEIQEKIIKAQKKLFEAQKEEAKSDTFWEQLKLSVGRSLRGMIQWGPQVNSMTAAMAKSTTGLRNKMASLREEMKLLTSLGEEGYNLDQYYKILDLLEKREKATADYSKAKQKENETHQQLLESIFEVNNAQGTNLTVQDVLSGKLKENVNRITLMTSRVAGLARNYKEFKGNTQDAKKELDEINQELEENKDKTDSSRKAVEEHKKEIEQSKEEMKKLGDEATITTQKIDTFGARRKLMAEKMSEELDKVKSSWDDVETTLSEGEEQFVNITQNLASDFSDTLSGAFTEMADEGTLSFQRLGEAFKNTLIQMTSEMAARAGIFALFSAFLPGNAATAAGILTGGKGSSAIDYIFGSFADGGNLPAYEIGLVGENGPELIMPQQDTEIIDTETLERVLTSPRNVNVNITGKLESTTSHKKLHHLVKLAEQESYG